MKTLIFVSKIFSLNINYNMLIIHCRQTNRYINESEAINLIKVVSCYYVLVQVTGSVNIVYYRKFLNEMNIQE